MTVDEIIKRLENLSPPMFDLDWDNSGLLVGHLDGEVDSILVALDASDDVVEEAINKKVQMIITHHPLIFKGLKKVSDTDFIGRRILRLAENHIALYAMHTNFDVACMADEAADYMELSNSSVLSVTFEDSIQKEGIGRVGMLPKRTTLKACANQVKEAFHIDSVRVFGDLNRKIDIVAICPGSGGSCIDDAIKSGAQLLITGDIDHHEGIDAVAKGLNIIDASHYGLEMIFVDYLKQYIDENIPDVKGIAASEEAPFIVM